MPYTLSMFLLWAVLIAVIGAVIGWMLRSLQQRVRDGRSGADRTRQPGGSPPETP